jgi:hypothetical protein
MAFVKLVFGTYFGSNLVSALAGLDVNDFPHFVGFELFFSWFQLNKIFFTQIFT